MFHFRLLLLAVIAALGVSFIAPSPAEAGPIRRVGRGIGRIVTAPVRFFRNGGFFRRGGCGFGYHSAPACNAAPACGPACHPTPAGPPKVERSVLLPKEGPQPSEPPPPPEVQPEVPE